MALPFSLAIALSLKKADHGAFAVRVLSVPCSFSGLLGDQTESDADFIFTVHQHPLGFQDSDANQSPQR